MEYFKVVYLNKRL